VRPAIQVAKYPEAINDMDGREFVAPVSASECRSNHALESLLIDFSEDLEIH
jgi:hypothetical protein